MLQPSEQTGLRRLEADAVVDAAGVEVAPGVLLLRGDTVVAAGSPAEVGVVAEAEVESWAGSTLLPAMVNAHAHLDLSSIAPRPFEGDFDAWLLTIGNMRRAQQAEDRRRDVQLGVELSLAGGTALIGDIAGHGHLEPLETLRASPLQGDAFIEYFGLGTNEAPVARAMQALADSVPRDEAGVRLGLSPHAPYSCGLSVYAAALATGLPVATHLAESLEEEQMLATATGPMRELCERLGAWNDEASMPGLHPVAAMESMLSIRPSIAVHLNYIEDEHVELLASTGTRVVYCPRASDYFGHPHAGRSEHRYRQLVEAGVCVALGTDSLQCLDTPDRISTLDEMRHLWVRDGADPRMLLAMATTHGAMALDRDPSCVTFQPGPVAGVIAVDTSSGHGTGLAGVLSSREAPRWVIAPRQVAAGR